MILLLYSSSSTSFPKISSSSLRHSPCGSAKSLQPDISQAHGNINAFGDARERLKSHTENALSSSSTQSSPSRNIAISENEVMPTAIPVAMTRQIPSGRSPRILHFNSPNPISTPSVPLTGLQAQQLQQGSRQIVYTARDGQQIGTQSVHVSSSTNLSLVNPTNHSGAIPRRNIRRGNNATDEEQCNENS